MPLLFEPRFTRQAIPKIRKGCVVVPKDAHLLPGLPINVQRAISSLTPPNNPTSSFRFHYLEFPLRKDIFEDNIKINDGIYEFLVKDAVLSVYDLQSFRDNEFLWSFATTDQTVVLAALNIGETFDVKLKRPFYKTLHISRYHFPSGVLNSGYGEYPVHISIDEPQSDWFRITTSYEPYTKRANSRLPFFFGFKVYGFRNEDRRPIWRKFLSDATIYAQKGDWGTGLMHIAFALESFIDSQLLLLFNKANFGESYQDHLLRVGEKREEFHALLHKRKQKAEINRIYEKINKSVFQLRNNIAHGKKTRESITSEQFINSMKMAIELIWDLDKKSRSQLLPITYQFDPSSLIDEQLIENCKKSGS